MVAGRERAAHTAAVKHYTHTISPSLDSFSVAISTAVCSDNVTEQGLWNRFMLTGKRNNRIGIWNTSTCDLEGVLWLAAATETEQKEVWIFRTFLCSFCIRYCMIHILIQLLDAFINTVSKYISWDEWPQWERHQIWFQLLKPNY